jgi:hypothetical protein
MADDDADVIYIDVVPQLDEGESRRTSERVKDAFKGVSKGIGKEWGCSRNQRRTISRSQWPNAQPTVKEPGIMTDAPDVACAHDN